MEEVEGVIGEGETGEEWKEKFNELWKGLSAAGGDSWAGEFDDFATGADSRGGLIDPDPVTGALAEYKFEANNPFLSHPDPLAEGIRIVEQGSGTLSEAALAFEAAAQRHPARSEVWMRLGHVQAENEKEGPAIAALQRSVQENPDNLPALMVGLIGFSDVKKNKKTNKINQQSLAISYTNEGQELQAYASLERWIRSKYPSVANANLETTATSTSFLSPQEFHDRCTKIFLDAVHAGPTAAAADAVERGGLGVVEGIDPDVQVGLGVLFYINRDFDKAIDCFHSALTAKPTDYILWNRLGATLANSGRSECVLFSLFPSKLFLI